MTLPTMTSSSSTTPATVSPTPSSGLPAPLALTLSSMLSLALPSSSPPPSTTSSSSSSTSTSSSPSPSTSAGDAATALDHHATPMDTWTVHANAVAIADAAAAIDAIDAIDDIFGPPRTAPLRHTRPRVPMISAKLRLREERKRVMQLCAHKLERIRDTESNLLRSVCINNTYSRLTDEVRREKQSRYLDQLPRSEPIDNANSIHAFMPTARPPTPIPSSSDMQSFGITASTASTTAASSSQNNGNGSIIFGSFGSAASHASTQAAVAMVSMIPSAHTSHQLYLPHQHNHLQHQQYHTNSGHLLPHQQPQLQQQQQQQQQHHQQQYHHSHLNHHHHHHHQQSASTSTTPSAPQTQRPARRSAATVDADLESLDRELNALNASMPLIDLEITQGAEQLERAASRKRSHHAAIAAAASQTSAAASAAAAEAAAAAVATAAARAAEEENDRLVREALAQFYLPAATRLVSAIDDVLPLLPPAPEETTPVDDASEAKRARLDCSHEHHHHHHHHHHDVHSSMEIIDVVGFGGTILDHSGAVQSHATDDIIDVVSAPATAATAAAVSNLDFELGLTVDHSQNSASQNHEFDVILDALRLGSDSCGQAAMMGEAGAFHNLVVASLET